MLLAAVALPGCAWRAAGAEHYFGPALFRYSDPAKQGCAVADVWQLGLLGEGGSQWGVAVGVAERMTARDAPPGRDPAPRWSRPLSPWPEPAAGEWSVSLLYLRGEDAEPPILVRRRLAGAGATAGSELTALSLGLSSRLTVLPGRDSFSVLVFDSRRPLDGRCTVLPASALQDGSLSQALEEVR